MCLWLQTCPRKNLSYWIWKSLKPSGRPGCLIFMLVLGLLSCCPARQLMESVGLQGKHLHVMITRQFGETSSKREGKEITNFPVDFFFPCQFLGILTMILFVLHSQSRLSLGFSLTLGFREPI